MKQGIGKKSLKRAETLKENDGLGVISGRQYRHDSIQMPEMMAETSAGLQHLVKEKSEEGRCHV